MDYLDAGKELRHNIMLFVGYVLIAIAITLTAVILLYRAYGFGVGKNGDVIQNGLTFFSSQPNPADIYVDGKLKSAKTNTRMVLPAGIYQIKLAREGYRDWQRTVTVQGGKVQRYDYPFLFPETLTPQKIRTFTAAPGFMTQSPDRRWLLIQRQLSFKEFLVYDLKSPAEQPVLLTLPDELLSKAIANQGWSLVSWASDNEHALLQHNFDGKTEYILINRVDPAQSINLSKTLNISNVRVALSDKKYDRYYIYNPATSSLHTASLEEPIPKSRLEGVLAYQSYGEDTLLYATAADAEDGKIAVKLMTGARAVTVRQLPASPGYVLDLTEYDGTMYVAAGATNGSRVYIYRDPAGQLSRANRSVPVPSQVLHVDQPNYLSFSASAQFIVVENGNNFGVYDIENEVGYNFATTEPLDPPQIHASWMDGNRLVYVSGGRLLVFDYDHNNPQVLMAASSAYLPAFGPDYQYVYAIAPSTTPGHFDLTQTSLLTAEDQ